ncbi:MAG: rRNA maturation RNase YbeY [Clostridia bacterium]|nr:rRNA maturation RNase YbeY [Clostridia bacterium]
MKVSFRNEQDKIKVTFTLKRLIKKALKTGLSVMGWDSRVDISVMFTDNEGIRVLNREHREIDRETDVLSFPLIEYDEKGEYIESSLDYSEKGNLCMGDIVLSLEKALAQAEEYGHSFERETGFLTVHSLLHLMGYDHMTEEEEKEMFTFQKEILDKMGLKR